MKGDATTRGHDPARDERPQSGAVLRLPFDAPTDLDKAFAESLGQAAVFVPSTESWHPGQPVLVLLDLVFCGRAVEVEGLVAAIRPAGLGGDGAGQGVSIQLRTSASALRATLEQASGMSLGATHDTGSSGPAGLERRAAPRGPAHGVATLVVGASHFPAELLNVSYEGMLVALNGLDLSLGSEVDTLLSHPQNDGTENRLSIDSRIVNKTACDHGKMAVGIQFQYPFRRIDEVMAFIDELQGRERAKQLAEISGTLEDAPLVNTMETLVRASREGTLRLSRGDEEGIIIHQDGEILHAATGLVTGIKAVSRLVLWTDGRFTYQAGIEPFEAQEAPRPIDSVLLEATVHQDEVERLGIERFDPDDVFRIDEALMEQLAPQLDEIHREVAEHVQMEFPLGAILDVLIHGDGVIYKALAELLESGVISR